MKRQTFNVLFFIRKTKLKKSGETPIMLRITIEGQLTELQLKRDVMPTQWNQAKERCTSRDAISVEINRYLESVKLRLLDIHREMEDAGKLINPMEIKRTYNNSGSCRQLANYMEHEDLERMEKGIYTEGFFNLTEDNIYKSKVIKDIDSNIGQLLKTDAKFYAIHVSPSEKELRAMGNTEQEKAEAMKRYIREVFIPEYANNFNKGLSEADIKFYGKIHFDRSRSDNELNMHCHLIVSRKDQSNKKKLSPLTNHKNTKKGTVTGGFDRVNLFQQAEQRFDKLFNYNRRQTETFHYHKTIKNGSISEQLKLQKREFQPCERKTKSSQDNNQRNWFSLNHENKEARNHAFNTDVHVTSKQENNNFTNKSSNQENNRTVDLSISIASLGMGIPESSINSEDQFLKFQKKKQKRRKF